ncbi:hypothetical protein [Pseudomonas sp. KB_15]|uniref:hypothetical protein n=1 Tax=Pseudomonas sp. KB_15 TaxID=3233035 RepID=UPI003F964AFB
MSHVPQGTGPAVLLAGSFLWDQAKWVPLRINGLVRGALPLAARISWFDWVSHTTRISRVRRRKPVKWLSRLAAHGCWYRRRGKSRETPERKIFSNLAFTLILRFAWGM